MVEDTDRFLKPIERYLETRHKVERFVPHFAHIPVVGGTLNRRLLDRQLQRFLFDHDVTFFEWASSLLVRATHFPKSGPIVTRLHSVELATTASYIDWSKVDHTVVLSRSIQRKLTEIAPTGTRIEVVPHGIDLRAFSPVTRDFSHRLGMVCSLLPIKRIYETILCVYRLRQLGHPFTLRVAGEPVPSRAPRYEWALRRLIEKLDLGEHVTLCGYIGDVPKWLSEIDVFLSNSYWEGQQVALLEAMASGCYCLSHFWDGVEEILPESNLYVTDRELTDKLIEYARSLDTEKMAAQQRMRMIAERNHDERHMVQRMEATLQGAART